MVLRIVGIILLALPYTASSGELDSLTKQVERRQEESVEIELNLSTGQVYLFRGARDLVADIRVMYDRDEHTASAVYEEIDPKAGKLTLTSRRRKDTILGHFDARLTKENIWRVELNPRIAYTLKGDLGVVTGELDFTGLKTNGLELDIGASILSILFNAKNEGHIPLLRINAGASKLRLKGLGNARFDMLDVNGGAGQFTLDFSGDLEHRAQVELSLGFGTATILIPREIGARIEASDGLLTSVSVDGGFEEVRRREYTNDSYGNTKGQLEIDVDAAFGSVTIEETEAED